MGTAIRWLKPGGVSGITATDITNDTPAAYKTVILGLVPSIRVGDGVEF
jgi:hypothetical protein